jgi:ABC-type spermidine/putrescine transport system permease subunit I
MLAAGFGFAGTNVATKLLSDDLALGHVWPAVLWAVFGLGLGVAATVTGMTAFRRRRATVVVPFTTAVQTYLPLLLEPLFLKERWGSADYAGAPIFAGVLIALVGTVLITRTDAVADLAAGAQS